MKELIAIAGILSIVNGCTAAPAHEGLEVRDSAGVRVVVAHDSLGEEHFPELRLLARVDTIGVSLGEDPYQFTYVVGAAFTRGGILVADRLTREIRYFDGRGRHLASLGRRGEGPGEFQSLSWIQRGPDGTLVAWDGTASRLTSIAVGDSALSLLSSRRLNVVPWQAQAMGAVGVGRLLLVGAGSRVRPPPVPGRIGGGGDMEVGVASEDMLPEMEKLGTVRGRPAYVSEDSQSVPVPFTVLPDYAPGLESVWFGGVCSTTAGVSGLAHIPPARRPRSHGMSSIRTDALSAASRCPRVSDSWPSTGEESPAGCEIGWMSNGY